MRKIINVEKIEITFDLKHVSRLLARLSQRSYRMPSKNTINKRKCGGGSTGCMPPHVKALSVPLPKAQPASKAQVSVEVLLADSLGSWGDEMHEVLTPAQLKDVTARMALVKAAAPLLTAEELAILDQERQDRLKAKEEAIAAAKDQMADWASEDYWAANHCHCPKMTEAEYDALSMGELRERELNPCPCYQKIHLDADGTPSECRYFNSPAGCRDGAKCMYKHVERSAADIPCRFEASSAGCHPPPGRKCPYKHTCAAAAPTVQAAEVMCRFDGRCQPRAGTSCPYKHVKQGAGQGTWRSAGAAGAAAGAAAGGGAAPADDAWRISTKRQRH